HQIKMERPNGQAKYCFHSLRHFYASIMIAQGTPPKRLQSLLGHTTLAMTMDTYGHLFPAGEDESVRINNAVASVLTSDLTFATTGTAKAGIPDARVDKTEQTDAGPIDQSAVVEQPQAPANVSVEL